MQQSTHNLGHSKHRKAFGPKWHKGGFARIRLQKDIDAAVNERVAIREAHKQPMFASLKELFGH